MDQIFQRSTVVRGSAESVFAWHARPGAFERLVPPWQRVDVVEAAALEDGSRATLRFHKGPLRLAWVAEHRDVRPGRGFVDVQVRGPFSRWEHEHRFEPVDEATSTLNDTIHYRLPLGMLGVVAAGRRIHTDLESTFRYRHAVTAADLETHVRYSSSRPLTIAISGAGGLIGSSLAALLLTGGHHVLRLVRRAPRAPQEVEWNPQTGVAVLSRLEGVDAVVHLAGENIGDGRWTDRRRDRIRRSRVEATRNLIGSLATLRHPPGAFLGASGVSFYGHRPDRWLDEDAAAGEGFLAEVCTAWEAETRRAREFGARTAMLRFGVVLSPRGGYLARVLPAFRAAAGGVLGDGAQQMSWISIDDAVVAVLHVLTQPELSGPINVTTPHPVSNLQLTRTLGRVLRRPTALALPRPVLRALLGGRAGETLLASARAVPDKLQSSGFGFRHPDLESALRYLLGREAP